MTFVTHQIEGVAVQVWATTAEAQIMQSAVFEGGLEVSPVQEWGWHGLSLAPCDGEWIADLDDVRGAIVVVDSDSDEEVELDLPDGWEWKLADLEDGWHYADESGWKCCVLHRHPLSGVVQVVGSC